MHNLIYNAPLNPLGYGVVGIQVLKQLHKDTNICCFPIGEIQITDQSTTDIVKQIHYNNHLKFPHQADNYILKVWHQNALFERPGKGKYFGWPIFELDRFTDIEIASLQQPDELIVCSQWAKAVVLHSLPDTKVHVVPLGVDRDIFHPESVLTEPLIDNYNFYTIGKLSKNKGHDILASAFNKAFEQSDKVQLHMITHNPFFNQQENDYWKGLFTKSKLGNKIKFHPRLDTHKNIANLINRYDCGIFCSRAEGWNLGLLESMACDKPVIATDYSGHTEYCNRGNCFLIYTNDKEDAHDGKWFNGQGKWAVLGLEQEEQLIERMRFCYKARVDINPNGLNTANKYSWDNTGKELKKALWSM